MVPCGYLSLALGLALQLLLISPATTSFIRARTRGMRQDIRAALIRQHDGFLESIKGES